MDICGRRCHLLVMIHGVCCAQNYSLVYGLVKSENHRMVEVRRDSGGHLV